MKTQRLLVYALITISLVVTNNVFAQTVPSSLKNVKIQARVILDDAGIYHYYHIVSNPAENTIGVGDVNIDISLPNYGNPPGYISVEGYAQPDNLTSSQAQKKGLLYIPVAWKNTVLWKGSVGLEDGRWSLSGNAAVISWGARYDFTTNNRYLLNPGATSNELESISYGLPSIRKVVFKPIWWVLNLPDDFLWGEENTLEENIAAERKKESLGCLGTTIGPTAPPAYTPLQFNQMMQEYVTQSVNLGWLKDAALTKQLNNYLVQINTALKEERFMDAQSIVTQFMNAVQNSNLTQRTNEAYALLYYNAKFFFNKLRQKFR